MVTPLKDENLLSVEKRLNSLATRIADLERRVAALEQATGAPKADSAQQPVAPTNTEYRYLRRSIDRAKRDYEYRYR